MMTGMSPQVQIILLHRGALDILQPSFGQFILIQTIVMIAEIAMNLRTCWTTQVPNTNLSPVWLRHLITIYSGIISDLTVV
ncbi:hypothetical protein UFOVP1130_138 [uncultured Caudovirales phage]|uniref:Uncharacterized protein n=1 Tax=uncultured Caudovirales phage TaxID=2100421 RepID=A0A6J5QMD8_9CAUD|nr:hypothetical protein UFOVP1130_138 [uncultured Caudovirales phage]